MAKHRVYTCIVKAVKSDKLEEPFTKDDFRNACPNFKRSTYKNFLRKHKIGNSGNETELFKEISPGRFKLVRPIKYGLDC